MSIDQTAPSAGEYRQGIHLVPCLINLDRSPQRLAFMDETLRAQGIEYRRVPAVDGSSLSAGQIAAVFTRRAGEVSLSPGEVACFLSHRQCWRLIVESGAAYGCVFEDDVEFSPHLGRFLAASDWIPADADIVKLESYAERVWFDRRRINLAGGFSLARMHSGHYGGAAYLISRNAARRLLETTRHFHHPVDVVLFEPGHGLQDCVVYQVLPGLAMQSVIRHRSKAPRFLASTLQHERRERQLPPLTRIAKIRRDAIRSAVKLAHRLRGRERLAVRFDPPPAGLADAAREEIGARSSAGPAMQSYLVNLDRSVERLAFMDERFQTQGIDYRRVAAVDGHRLTPAEIDAVLAKLPGVARLSAGEVGCFLSHRKCWRLIVDSGATHGCVFEDDAELSPRVGGFLRNTGWIPPDADIVKLETTWDKVWFDRNPIELADGFRLGRMRSSHHGCAAYIVSRDAARRLLETSERFLDPVDVVMFNYQAGVAEGLVQYQVLPALAMQSYIRYGSGSSNYMVSTLRHQRTMPRFTHFRTMPRPKRELVHAAVKLGHLLRNRRRILVQFDTPQTDPDDDAPARFRTGQDGRKG